MREPWLKPELRIWGFAFGYFACYAPYSALTKQLSSGRWPAVHGPIDGFTLLPLSTFASLLGMLAFLSGMGWWKYAGHRTVLGLSLPCPNRWTFLSGLATAGIIATTTLAYTFEGLSIVFMMLLMRGGVLVLAPIVDTVSKRAVQVRSWVALGLSMSALLVSVVDAKSFAITLVAMIDVAIYLAGYFIRLRFMSKLAKTKDRELSIRYFVEEQMVATPAIVATLALTALIGYGPIMLAVRKGFTEIWSSGAILPVIIVGVLSQGTGVFGGLILLDGRENGFCVPVNRASSVLAGVLATLSLWMFADGKPAPMTEIIGASLLLSAILVLAWPKRKVASVEPTIESA
jgi:hypothetical protein